MEPLKLLYRDPDRTPWLSVLRFAAHELGLKVTIERAPGREYGELLERGEVDLLAENYYNLQSFRARGVPLVSLVTSITWLNEKLFVAPEINTLSGLNGKRFALRGVGSSELIQRLWLQDSVQDAEPVVYPEADTGRWGHWKKVLDGECQGCLVTNMYADPPTEAGLKELPKPNFGYLGNVTLTTRRDVIERDRPAAEALARAAFEASRLFKQDSSRTLGFMISGPAKLMGLERQAQIERVYALQRDELSDQPIPSLEGLLNMRRMAAAADPGLAEFNPLLIWDLSFATKIADEPPRA